MDKSYYSTAEAAELLDVSVRTVLYWIGSGQVEAIDVSTRPGSSRPRYKIRAEVLLAFIQSRKTKMYRERQELEASHEKRNLLVGS